VSPGGGAGAALLECRGLDKRFGGLHAVRGVDLTLGRGEVRAVIGPNGAGKTTLVGLISGRLRADGGRIRFAGRDITGLRPWARVARGIVYTFQVSSVFAPLTCYENVALAARRRLMRGLLDRLWLPEERVASAVAAALAEVGLEAAAEQPADALPYGHRRLLEVAMALALEPALLILDEPTQGLAEGEIEALCALVRRLAGAASRPPARRIGEPRRLAGTVTVLLIEHNMEVVLSLAERITVLDEGAVLAEGVPAEIEAHPGVRRAYLGG